MKKRVLSLFLALVMVLALVPTFTIASTAAITADTSWYDETKDVFEISTPEQLLGFAKLLSENCKELNDPLFGGKTIKLTADIDLNPGWDAAGTANPTTYWPGMAGRTFTGTFDGQGHTVKGIRVETFANTVGIFGGKPKDATIKNLVIENSLVRGAGLAGGLFGQITGTCTIENVYVDILVEGNIKDTEEGATNYDRERTGGLVGTTLANSTLIIKNTVFAGTVTHKDQGFSSADATRVGGFLGAVLGANSTVTIENSAFYGTVNANMWAIGGFVGVLTADTGTALTIKNSISAGQVNNTGNNATGAILGQKQGGTATVENVAYIKVNNNGTPTDWGIQGATWGSGAIVTSSIVGKVPASVSGFVAGETMPLPAGNAAIGKNVQIDPVYFADSSWYNTTDTTFEIGTPEQLLGFATLIQGGKLKANQTVKLTADVNLNPGWTAGVTAPTNVWGNTNGTMHGIFDGQGHTISGVYSYRNGDCVGIFGGTGENATVKNLVVLNSYVSGTEGVGGIFGRTLGTNTVENVYLDVDIVSTAAANAGARVGGLIGRSGNWDGNAATGDVIRGCVFAGTVSSTVGSTKYMGGLVGCVSNAAAPLIIENSAFYGTVTSSTWDNGGLVGSLNDGAGNVTITNCISAGEVTGGNNVSNGAILGRVGGYKGTLTITNTYYGKITQGSLKDQAGAGVTSGVTLIEDKATLLNGTVPANLTDFVAMPGYEILPINLVNPVWKNNTDATTVCDLYQAKGNDIRLIGLVNGDISAITAVGYDIEMIRANGKTWTNKVGDAAPVVYSLYTSVMADGVQKTAAELGGDYIFVATIGGMDATVNENITIVLKTFHDTADGRVYDDVIVFTYNPATAQVNA